MNTIIKSLVVPVVFFANNIMAQEDISGTWQGKLSLEGDATLTVQFILHREADGTWSATVNSPDTGGIKNVTANAVDYDGRNLKIEVAELSGGYAGAYTNGVFEGEWSQAGTSMPLNLKPYVKPELTRADMDKLQGEWNGKLKIPVGELTIVFRFETTESGEFKGFLDSPDQGANGIPISDIELDKGDLKFKIPRIIGEYQAVLDGDEMTGTFTQGQPLPLNMHKGKYQAPDSRLSLTKEAMDQLRGEWHGELDTPVGSMTVVYRFESDSAGEFIAFRINPDQGGASIPVIEASLTDGDLSIKTAGPGGVFKGKLAGDEITGTMQGPLGALPLTLVSGQYVAPSYPLDLSREEMDQIQGKWQGKLKTPQRDMTLIFRFEAKGEGEYYGFVDSPDQGASGLKITEASFADGELLLKTKFPRAQFKGKLSGDKLDGQWKQGPANMPLSMNKD